MTQVRRVPRILLFLIVPIVIAACAARPATPDRGAGGVCSTGQGDPNFQAPIVCVDDDARVLTVNPDPVIVDDVQGGRPVTLVWMTKSGSGDLQIEVKDPGCVRNVVCPGNGRCTAQAIPRSTATCKYDVWINGGNHDRLDPTVVIQPCCGG